MQSHCMFRDAEKFSYFRNYFRSISQICRHIGMGFGLCQSHIYEFFCNFIVQLSSFAMPHCSSVMSKGSGYQFVKFCDNIW